tara:strand:+ start:131 stop:298 length:168 start_codon:yes stop_codon:yes gene_type:complete
MKYERAKTILTKRAEDYYGKTFDWLIEAMDNGFDENNTVTDAYNAYKKKIENNSF